MKDRYASFYQSTLDFPCSVELGKNKPTFGINRWGNNALRFIPTDDEGFSVRGDKRQLLYKGRRRSHRFTVHSDTSFEYDCILLKEPDCNTVCLRMEGAENFDFFRQPDFVRDDFLKGSYAVYKKETLIGEGTGKLCHIHRPLIIDALGRRCWGVLSVVGNELRITIPEKWLSEAKYPVTVDPTVGTTTIGSQWKYYNEEYEPGWYDEEDEWLHYFAECSIDVSKFVVPEVINGTCTAFFYAMSYPSWAGDENGGRPVFYSDLNNKPNTRRSRNENLINFNITSSNPVGWRSGTFASNESIPAGSNIWFGCFASYLWFFRFDFGSNLYRHDWTSVNVIPNAYPTRYNLQLNYKVSMYFTYTSPQNYVRTLTQGINLTDARVFKAEYKRNLTQTNNITDTRNNKADYKREASENVNAITAAFALFSFFRNCFNSIGNTDNLFRFPSFFRNVNDDVKIDTENNEQRELNRICGDTAVVSDTQNKKQDFFRSVLDGIENTDHFSFSVLFVRSVQDTQTISDTLKQVRNFIRCLKIEAANLAETERSGDFFRIENDTANVDGSVLRELFIFIKLVSSCFVRDFNIKRFLIAREELVLKSCITKELTLESKIN